MKDLGYKQILDLLLILSFLFTAIVPLGLPRKPRSTWIMWLLPVFIFMIFGSAMDDADGPDGLGLGMFFGLYLIYMSCLVLRIGCNYISDLYKNHNTTNE